MKKEQKKIAKLKSKSFIEKIFSNLHARAVTAFAAGQFQATRSAQTSSTFEHWQNQI